MSTSKETVASWRETLDLRLLTLEAAASRLPEGGVVANRN